MKILTCTNGHYFDVDKYTACPHCGACVGSGEKKETMPVNITGQVLSQSPEPKQSKKKTLFGRRKTEENNYSGNITRDNYVTSTKDSEFRPVVPQTNVMARPMPSATVMASVSTSEDNPTVSMWDTKPEEIEDIVPQPIESQPVQPQPIQPQMIQSQPVQAPQQIMSQPVQNQMVKEQQKPQPPADNDLRTVMMFGSGDVEPVTGWLVCVAGECYGECFNISSGRNTIGRSTAMDIAIVGEPSISREKQAVIIFEPNKQKFIMQQGESNSLTYVNDELLMNYVELKAYDLIQMGNAKFIFLPLCGEKFNWKDYSQE